LIFDLFKRIPPYLGKHAVFSGKEISYNYGIIFFRFYEDEKCGKCGRSGGTLHNSCIILKMSAK